VQIAVARVLLVEPEPLGGADDVAAVERTDPQVAERPLDPGLERVQADVLDEQPQEVLVREWAGGILFIPEALVGEVAVDLLAVLVFASSRSWCETRVIDITPYLTRS